MQSIQEETIVDLILCHKKQIHFPQGLGGFEEAKDFFLVINSGEMPLIWMESLTIQNLAFLTVDPYLFYPDYEPEFPKNLREEIQLDDEDVLLVLAIANVKKAKKQGVTLDLIAPLTINWTKGIGKQIIILNSKEYSFNAHVLRDTR